MCACRGTAGFAHVSCLAEQAKILFAEALENNLDDKAKQMRWNRWHTCSLCEQKYHGVVACALGWACWKAHLGRPERDEARNMAMTQLGNGLSEAEQNEDAMSVQEADLAMQRRIGAPAYHMLTVQGNLATTYLVLGRHEEAILLKRDVYSGYLKLYGEEHEMTLTTANNHVNSLIELKRFKEAKALMRKTIPVARRVLSESNELTLRLRWSYGQTLCADTGATLDDLREAVTTLEEVARTARRVFGGAHPITGGIEHDLKGFRAALRAREQCPRTQVHVLRKTIS